MSVFDWVVSLAGGLMIGFYLLKLKTINSSIIWLIIWTFIGIIVHYAMDVDTMLGYYLGINKYPKRKICSYK